MVNQHLGIFSDMVEAARRQAELYPLAAPGPETQRKVREILGWFHRPAAAQDVRVERTWEKDGLCGEEISWWVGYGPRTKAWILKPAGSSGPLPAVLGLHDHGGFKYYGKEKIAEGPDDPEPFVRRWWKDAYGGQAWANALAREGFAVLIHDTFLWGSRKFPLEDMRRTVDLEIPDSLYQWYLDTMEMPRGVAEYNALAGAHEHIVSKYCNLLGTGMPGVVCYEDRVALEYLRSRPDVQEENVSCMGLSGGGNRAGTLRATAEGLNGAVVVGLMSTYAGLLDHNVAGHTWMFFPFDWARCGDWPDLVACRAPAPLLVQYDLEDGLFTVQGMHDADARLKQLYGSVGAEEAYTGQFYPGPHKFDLEMQRAAFAWLIGLQSDQVVHR